MSILQKLYEGGHITYHRTDSTNLSTHIQTEIKSYILNKFGTKYSHMRNYKSKIKCAQEAHEAIRPTHIDIEGLSGEYESLDKRIYDIIWKRTVASQMSDSITDVYTISIKISNRDEKFISKAEKMIFDGYKRIYDDTIKKDDDDNAENADNMLDSNFIIDTIKEGEILKYIKISCLDKYSNPPLRYTEASLIKKMEKIGVGRPSTYASIMETIVERKYVEKKDVKGKKIDIVNIILEKNNIKEKKDSLTLGGEKKKLLPTSLGLQTNEFLEKNFINILESNFTASMEENLDNVANGTTIWTNVLKDFYSEFEPNVIKLNSTVGDNKRYIGLDNNGKEVYVYIAKFGPIFQIGSGTKKDVQYVPLELGQNISTVTIEDFNSMTVYPKMIGKYKEKDILLKKGTYGLYLTYNECNYKLIEDYDVNINLEEAIKCIEPSETSTEQKKEGINKKIDDYTIKEGPYGPYILYNKKFYSIPKEYDLEKITKKDCCEIIKIPKKKYVKK
jgi:DNA topoisomerase-1